MTAGHFAPISIRSANIANLEKSATLGTSHLPGVRAHRRPL